MGISLPSKSNDLIIWFLAIFCGYAGQDQSFLPLAPSSVPPEWRHTSPDAGKSVVACKVKQLAADTSAAGSPSCGYFATLIEKMYHRKVQTIQHILLKKTPLRGTYAISNVLPRHKPFWKVWQRIMFKNSQISYWKNITKLTVIPSWLFSLINRQDAAVFA